jgi:pimeloyl-ACP methyl ester carboxylesterase
VAVETGTVEILGEKDDLDNHEIADTLEAGISRAWKVTLPDAAHLLNLEEPEEFNRMVLRFLERLEKEHGERSSPFKG